MKAICLVFFLSLAALAQKPASAKLSELEKKLKADDASARRPLTDDELEQKFFKNKIKKDKPIEASTQLMIPVFYERMEHPVARVKSRVSTNVIGPVVLEVDGQAIVNVISELLTQPYKDEVKKIALKCKSNLSEDPTKKDSTCWTDVTAFADFKVKVKFNEQLLEIRIRVPPEMRTKKITSLLHYGSFDTDEPTNQASWFSSFINVNVSQDFRSDAVEFKNGRLPLAGHFDSGTRFGDVVVQAKARSLEKTPIAPTTDPVFVREDVRAVVDLPSIGSRMQLGDLSYPVRGFQSFRPLAGASLFTQLNLQSTQLTLPTGNYEIYLKRPSKIGIYINDQLIQTLALPAGRHNLRDFPFVIGLNDLKLEIVDDLGAVETLNFSYFSSNELLKEGQNEISYSAGAPWTEVDGVRIYDSSQTTVSVFHRYGFAQSLTLGANVQKDSFQTIGGLEFLFSNRLGFFSIEPGYTLNKDHPNGYAGKIRYTIQDSSDKEKNTRFTAFELSAYNPDFASLGDRNPINPVTAKAQVTHSRALSKSANLNLSLAYNFNRKLSDSISDSYSFSVGATKRWMDGLSTNLNFRHTKSPTGIEEVSVLLFLVLAFPKERQFVTASSESTTGASRADWTYQPSEGVGGLTSHVNLQNKQGSRGYGESIEYLANRVRLSQSHQVEIINADLSQSPPLPQRSLHATNLQFGSALVFAGGRFAISRPVSDSFAILAPLDNLDGQNIQVNPQKNGTYLAETDSFGSAVASDLPSYSTTVLTLGQKNLKQTSSLPQDHFTLKPKLHSGYLIPIGSDATVYLKTKLLNVDGTPVSMIAAQAYYLNDKSKEPVMLFTNRNGLVRSEGFRKGRYRLEISDSEYEPTEFEIPDNVSDEYNMPNLILKTSKK